MNKEIPETEQWMLNGDCKKCRRKAYCGKPCKMQKTKVFERLRESLLAGFAGAFSKKKD